MANTEAMPYIKKAPEKSLTVAEREKKRNYIDSCLQQRHQFSPFVISVNDLLETQANATLHCLSVRLSTNWWQPYSTTCGYVQNRSAITMVRSTHLYIRGSRMPEILISFQWPQWEDGADFHLYRYKGEKNQISAQTKNVTAPLSHIQLT